MSTALIVDTGPIVAAANTRDPDHEASRAVLEAHVGRLVTTPAVVVEAGWLIRRQLGVGAEVALYTSVAEREIDVEPITVADWRRVADLVHTYRDISLDLADASLVAVAERLDERVVATLDERDFRIVRPKHVPAFDLLPGPV